MKAEIKVYAGKIGVGGYSEFRNRKELEKDPFGYYAKQTPKIIEDTWKEINRSLKSEYSWVDYLDYKLINQNNAGQRKPRNFMERMEQKDKEYHLDEKMVDEFKNYLEKIGKVDDQVVLENLMHGKLVFMRTFYMEEDKEKILNQIESFKYINPVRVVPITIEDFVTFSS